MFTSTVCPSSPPLAENRPIASTRRPRSGFPSAKPTGGLGTDSPYTIPLSPPLEIFYSPISNPSPMPPADFPPHPPSPPQIDIISSIPHHGYSPAAPFPLLFHDAQELLEYMARFIPSSQDLVVVRIPGSDGLFSVPVASLVPLDLFSLNPYDPSRY